MNVLRVIATMDPASGGPCQGIRNSIPELDHFGCQTEVVCLDDPDAEFGMEDSFRVHRLERGRGPWATSPSLAPWLNEHLAHYDVVILHGLWLYPSYAVTKAIRQLRRNAPERCPRFFVMPHGMLDPWFQRHPSRRLKAIRNWFVWKAVEQHTIATADGLLFTCERELELARETFSPYRPRAEINVGYGVPEPPAATPAMAQTFRETVPGLGDRPYLLFLSRIHPKKGVDLLIDAYLNLVQDRGPSPPAPLPAAGRGERSLSWGTLPDLVIAGPTDSEYAKQMRWMAIELGLEQRVHFPGMLSGDAKWGAFYDCEAFILPSHQENFGIAVVEALACGRPVLISDQVNICREIKNAGAGFVQPDTLGGTSALLRDFCQLSTDERGKMSAAAKTCFATHFSVQEAAANLLQAISTTSH